VPRILSRTRNIDEPHIGKYRLGKTIGKGNFAKVKLAKHMPTGREVSLFFSDNLSQNISWVLFQHFRIVKILKKLMLGLLTVSFSSVVRLSIMTYHYVCMLH